MTDNTIIVKGNTADRLLDLLERTEDLYDYFTYHDRFTIDRRHLEFWIDDIFNLYRSFEESYDNETCMNDVLYQVSYHRYNM